MNGRYAAGLAKIAASRNRGRREVGRLGGGPDQGEMEGRRKVWRGQFGERKASKLASESCDRLAMHRDGRVCLGPSSIGLLLVFPLEDSKSCGRAAVESREVGAYRVHSIVQSIRQLSWYILRTKCQHILSGYHSKTNIPLNQLNRNTMYVE